jgi:preprotein translocase subunit SecF
MLVWKPWSGLELQARGLNFGVDIAGGSRVILQLDMPQVNTENLSSTTILENTISKLQERIDPYGLLGFRFRTLGENKLLCEMTQLNDRAEKLLSTQGRLEMFAENTLVITDKNIETFYAPALIGQEAGLVYSSIPVKYTEGGGMIITAEFGAPTLAAVVYLDRPSDAILVFEEGIQNGVSNLKYDNDARRFTCTTKDIFTRGELQYPLMVDAVGTSMDNLSPEALSYLENQTGAKTRVIFLGTMEKFENVADEIPDSYKLENISRLEGESVDKWVKRTCGLISDFSGYWTAMQNRIVIQGNLQEARDIRAILSNKTPTKLSIISETEVKASLGTEFVNRTIAVAAITLAGALAIIYLRYRRWKVPLAIVGILACEFVITLAAASVLNLTIGLPEIGGILLVITTGISHLLIMTDVMLKGVAPQTGAVNVGWRASRALAIIYAAIFAIVVVMVPIGLLGFGMIRGFVLITISGTILAFLFTRPFYTKILDAISAS